MFFYYFYQKSLFTENYFLIAAINLATWVPLYTCLVYLIGPTKQGTYLVRLVCQSVCHVFNSRIALRIFQFFAPLQTSHQRKLIKPIFLIFKPTNEKINRRLSSSLSGKPSVLIRLGLFTSSCLHSIMKLLCITCFFFYKHNVYKHTEAQISKKLSIF